MSSSIASPNLRGESLCYARFVGYAATANSPAIVVQYGQMLLKLTPDDPKLLNLMVDALTREDDRASELLGVDYTSRLIKIGEAGRDRAALCCEQG